mgnify:CR=1 FL=1
MLFDSHSHLHFHQFDNDREEIIKKLRDFNIKAINVGTDLEESKKAVELSKRYPDVLWASVGLHPNDISVEIDWKEFEKLASNEIVVAIGECGLDYFRSPSESEIARQKEIFIKQIELAKELNKPLILHCRPSSGTQDAYDDVLDVLVSCHLSLVSGNGVAHFFVGSKETAKKFLDLEFYISFSGSITFPLKALRQTIGGNQFIAGEQYEKVVKFIPMNRILIETDSPLVAPVPYRGKRNEPAYVEFTARQIAKWKNLDFKEVARQTAENAKNLFNISI